MVFRHHHNPDPVPPPLTPNRLLQAKKQELQAALLEAVSSALFYNPQLTLQWSEANNATQVS